MDPRLTALGYDALAAWWLDQMRDSQVGLSALERAVMHCKNRGSALDVGCGSEGRFLKTLLQLGFRCDAVDISTEMIALARQRFPEVDYFVADITDFILPDRYDLICAWDSTFHLPLDRHQSVLEKLCGRLHAEGVILFTCGGGELAGEVSGSFGGQNFEYSTLGVPGFIDCLGRLKMNVLHLEYDQHPENHVVIMARKER